MRFLISLAIFLFSRIFLLLERLRRRNRFYYLFSAEYCGNIFYFNTFPEIVWYIFIIIDLLKDLHYSRDMN